MVENQQPVSRAPDKPPPFTLLATEEGRENRMRAAWTVIEQAPDIRAVIEATAAAQVVLYKVMGAAKRRDNVQAAEWIHYIKSTFEIALGAMSAFSLAANPQYAAIQDYYRERALQAAQAELDAISAHATP